MERAQSLSFSSGNPGKLFQVEEIGIYSVVGMYNKLKFVET